MKRSGNPLPGQPALTAAACLLLSLIFAFCVRAEDTVSAVVTAGQENSGSSVFEGIHTVSENTSAAVPLKVELDTGDNAEVMLCAPSSDNAKQGEFLGYFSTTGFCTCKLCTGGNSARLTASGTTPRAGHTVAADTSRFPFGTRLIIDGIVYTVEDEGTGVKGNWIDIYYATHEEAVAHGTRYEQAVYAAAD